MAIPTHDYEWPQGADLDMNFIYMSGPDGNESPVNLTGYKLRMDIRSVDISGARVYTFNSDDIAGDVQVDVTGPSDNEAVLGADGSINITVPRSLTLPGGPIYTVMASGTTVFAYDIFLRAPNNKQTPILAGTITVVKSTTLWA